MPGSAGALLAMTSDERRPKLHVVPPPEPPKEYDLKELARLIGNLPEDERDRRMPRPRPKLRFWWQFWRHRV